jgi:hypothetical protein
LAGVARFKDNSDSGKRVDLAAGKLAQRHVKPVAGHLVTHKPTSLAQEKIAIKRKLDWIQVDFYLPP